MAIITLKPLDDGQKAVEIPVGKTTIGRGPFLGVCIKPYQDVTDLGLTFINVNAEMYLIM